MVTTVSSDQTTPWFVDLVVKLEIHQINHARPQKYEEHILATPESGYEKYKVTNRWTLDRVNELKIGIDIKHAFLNYIAPTVNDFSRQDVFTNLEVRIVNTKNHVTPVTKTFFATKEVVHIFLKTEILKRLLDSHSSVVDDEYNAFRAMGPTKSSLDEWHTVRSFWNPPSYGLSTESRCHQ